MRKISTLLTMLFLLCGVCMAQSSRVVYLKTDGRGDNGRYMSCNAAGGLGSVAAKDNSALWVLNPVAGKADTYTLRNASNAGYVQAVWAFENQWKTVANASDASELVLEDMGDGTFGLRKADAASGSYYYAHLAGDMARIVIWYATDGNNASRWKVEDVEGELKATILSNVENAARLQNAIANAEANYANMLSSGYAKVGSGLVTDANQFYCNAPQSNPADGGGYPALIDGNTATFFHSRYWGDAVTENHYLQVTIDATAELKDFVVEYTARTQNAANRPTAIDVYGATGSADNLAWEAQPFAQLTTADGLGNATGSFAVVQSLPELAKKTYSALRFVVKSTNTGAVFGSYPFFTYSEFQVFGAEATKGPKYVSATEEDQLKLYNAIREAKGLDLTKDSYKAAADMLETTVAEVRENLGSESLDLLIAIDDAKEQLAAASTYANTPGQLSKAELEEWQAIIDSVQAVYQKYDKTDVVSRYACVEAQCMLERFLASHNMSNVEIPVESLTSGFFTIENPNASRGAVVYDAAQDAKVDPAHHNNNYVWYAEVKDVNSNNANHLWGFFENKENGELYLYNYGKKLFANPNGNGTYGDTWIFSKVPSPIKLEAMEAPFVRIMGDGKTMSVSRTYVGPVITYYAEGDGGVPFQFKRSSVTLSESDSIALAKQLQAYVDRPKLVRPLRDRIDFLWDMIAAERAHAAEVGHLNETALAALDVLVAEANEEANLIVITDEFERSNEVLVALNAAVDKLYADNESYIMPESGKYYTIKSDNSSDAHYHLAHFLIQNAANDFLVVPNSKGEFEKSAWRCVENEDGTFSFTNNDRYLAFGKTVADAYGWVLGAPLRREPVEPLFGCVSLYSEAQQEYLAVNAQTSSVEGFVPVVYSNYTPNMTTGSFYEGGSSYWKGWKNTEETVMVRCNNNDMHFVTLEEDEKEVSYIGCNTGSYGSGDTYRVELADKDQVIDCIVVTVVMKEDLTDELTISANGEQYTIGQEEQTIKIAGDRFILTGSNGKDMLLKNVEVYSHVDYTTDADLSTDFILEAVEVDEFGNISGGTTVGIDSIFNETAHDVYSLSGVLVRKQATNLNGLAKGVYVVNGKKVLVK